MANRDTAKQWFQTGDKPTESQFSQLLDFIRFKDEALGLSDDPELIALLEDKLDKAVFDAFEQGHRVDFDADGSYLIQEGFLLEKVIFLPGADTAIKVGSSANGDDILPEQEATEVKGLVIVVNVYAKAATTIHFTGVPEGSAMIFIKRKIKTA